MPKVTSMPFIFSFTISRELIQPRNTPITRPTSRATGKGAPYQCINMPEVTPAA